LGVSFGGGYIKNMLKALPEMNTLPVTKNNNSATRTIDSSKFAVLYVYRPESYIGAAAAYRVHIDNNTIYKARNNSLQILKIFTEGPITVWAKTFEKKSSVQLDVRYGKEYFVRCQVRLGFFIWHPKLTVVNPYQGKMEFEKIE